MVRLLSRIFNTNYPSLLVTYGLTLLENILELLYPLLIGRAIDDLLQEKYMGIISLASLWLLHTGIEVARNIFDTITFTRIYNNLVVSVVLDQHRKGVASSQIAARSALSREFVDFFEQDVPNLVTSIFGLIGSLVMLLLFDLRIVGYCLLIIILITLMQKFFIKKYLGFNYS
ncbi:hypothetical protein GlitD10_1337 [Gloeomargarita lithophora Alchichica-D10]|uniref:ABC transmembrane type-1 domain-containing protein n=1 Tax=Gloeomargarita lithophora Alchichica-D10 TaxID=1188229 RepID=A0A1J0ACK2_9CYAN|nr:ABC transporter six-transmembrane domain-containing protein [Gloeomargarita lithophora]APB33658.1 hypothetical protein GlitD10_1337 [Gloeomargarita lithophora Alchichica-D10]